MCYESHECCTIRLYVTACGNDLESRCRCDVTLQQNDKELSQICNGKYVIICNIPTVIHCS